MRIYSGDVRNRKQMVMISGVLLLAVLWPLGGAYAAGVPFGPARDIQNPFTGAISTVLADINGDGRLDVVGVAQSSSQVAWWDNVNGDGSVWTEHIIMSTATTFTNPRSIAVADVNGDGYPDVVACALSGPNPVVWFENVGGTGTNWQMHVIDASVSFPSFVVAGDINGDGHIDVVGTAFLANTIYWWENTSGDGSTWTRHTVDASFGNPYSLCLADINGDGSLDILGAGDSANEIAWWQNVGHGASWTKHSIATGFTNAEGVCAADIDGDGHLDVVGAAKGSNTIAWFNNVDASGDGVNWIEHTVDTNFTGATSVQAVDLNHDGHMDIIATAHTANTVAWWENDGTPLDNVGGDGNSWTKHVISSTFNDAYAVVTGDLDGDGDPDVVAAGFANGGNRISWFRNNTIHGNVTYPSAHDVDTTFTGARAAVVADVNRDGYPDIVGVAADGNTVAWWQNEGTSWTKRIVGSAAGATSVAVADMNGNGSPDIVVAASASNSVVWFENTAGDGTAWTPHVVSSSVSGAASVCVADVDRDGHPDIVCAAPGGGTVLWFANTAGDGSAWTMHTVTSSFPGANSVFAADINHDGFVDIAATSSTGNAVKWWQSDGTPADNVGGTDGNSWSTHVVDTSFTGADAITVADIDHDGKLDIVAAAGSGNQIAWWKNVDGAGTTWTKTVVDASSLGARSVYVADLNHDGFADIVGAAETGNEVSWYENVDGAGTSWVKHSVDAAFTGASDVTVGDINGDGKADIVGAAHGANTIRWWQNEGGQFGLSTVNISDGSINEGSAEGVLKIVATHNGRSGDSDEELSAFALEFESSPGVPLTSSQAGNLIQDLEIYKDNGDGVFNSGSDTLVTTVSAFSLVNGVQIVPFTHLDPNVDLSPGASQTYFVVTQLKSNASSQTPNHFMITHVAELGSAALDRSAGIPLDLQYTPDVSSVNTVAADITPPQVLSATDVSSTQVQVTFNEAMLNDGALTNPSNYAFNNGLSATAVSVVNATTIQLSTNTMTPDLTYTVTVSTSGPTDLAGNPVSGSANTANFVGYGGVLPKVASASATNSTTVQLVYTVAMQNNAALTNPANYTFNNGLTASSVTVFNSTTVDITTGEMLQGQSYVVTVSTSGPQDLSSNFVAVGGNTATFTGIGTAPQVISATAQNSTTVRVIFSEAMANNSALTTGANYVFTNGLSASAVTVVNATTVDVTTNEMLQGQSYTVTVSTSGPTDLGGNTVSGAADSAPFSGIGVKPQVSSATAVNSTTVQVVFSEAMQGNAALVTPGNYVFTNGLSASAVTVVNATTVDVTTNEMLQGQSYTVTVSTSGPVDLAGNPVSATANTANFTGLGTPPQVSSATAQNSTTVQVVFSEAMANNAALTTPGNYVFSNGLTASAVARISATTVDVTVNEMQQGQSYTVTVATTGLTDLAGNTVSSSGKSAAFSGIGTPPQVSSATATTSTTVRIVFNEAMANNAALTTASNYTFDNGLTASSVARISSTTVDVTVNEMRQGQSYTATVTPTGPTDLGGNTVSATANTASFTGIGTPPQVSSATATTSTTVRIVFNEAMANNAALTTASNYTFNNGLTASSVIRIDSVTVDVTVNEMLQGQSYTATVSTTGPTDLAGNHVSSAAHTATFTGVGQKPQVASAVASSPTLVQVTFGEAMANNAALTTASNYTFNNGLTASSVTRLNTTTVQVSTNTMTAGQSYTVTVSASGPTDLAGNTVSSSANTGTFVGYGGSLPSVVSATAQNSTTVRLVYSEAMTNNAALTTASNYTFDNGLTASAVAVVNSTTVDITTNEMKQDQTYTVAVSTSGPQDLSNNFLVAGGNTASFSGIGVLPRVVSATAQDSTTVRVVYSEAMSNDAALVALGAYAINGGISVVGAARVDTVTVDLTTSEMLDGGNYTVTVSTSGPTDLAGNPVSGSANTAVFTGIGVKPRVTGASVLDDTHVRVTFSEAMANNAALLSAGTYSFSGGSDGLSVTASAVTLLDASDVSVTVSGMQDGASYTLTVGAGPTDLAGNPLDSSSNTASFTGVRTGSGETFYVDAAASGPGDGSAANPFSTIGAAVAASAAGRNDLIIILAGVYPEHGITLKRGVVLLGEDGAYHTTVTGGAAGQSVFTLATGCAVRGLTITDSGSSAVAVPANAVVEVTNCVLEKSTIGLDAGSNSQVWFVNDVAFGNQTGVQGQSGAVFPLLTNSIFATNSTTGVSADPSAIGGTPYNDYFGNGTDLSGPSASPNDLFVDPLFVDSASGNFHLTAASACRGAGDPGAQFNNPDGTRNDLGADGGPDGVRDTLAPSAVAYATPVSGPAPLVVQFNGTASSDEWGIASYAWDVDNSDGIQTDLTGATPSFTYTVEGVYVATLTVTDNNGHTATSTVTISVGSGLPTATASVSPLAGPAPEQLQLSGAGVDPAGGPLTYAWDFDGNGTTDSTAQNPLYSLVTGSPLGSYSFTLTVTTNTLKSATAKAYFTATEEPIDYAELVFPATGAVVQVTNPSAATYGASVTIPAGALSSPAVVAIGPILNPPALKPVTYGPIVQIGPTGVALSQPVTVSIPHPASLSHPADITVVYYDAVHNRWKTTGISNVVHTSGTPNDFMTFTTTHFTIFAVCEPLKQGDVNLDGVVNAVDVQLVINAALQLDVSPVNADVNGDGTVNAVDVQLVINAALGLKEGRMLYAR